MERDVQEYTSGILTAGEHQKPELDTNLSLYDASIYHEIIDLHQEEDLGSHLVQPPYFKNYEIGTQKSKGSCLMLYR